MNYFNESKTYETETKKSYDKTNMQTGMDGAAEKEIGICTSSDAVSESCILRALWAEYVPFAVSLQPKSLFRIYLFQPPL